ncbi:MAG: pectin acetylesterase-family hydrolase [Kofleriaceae bacterium]
MKRLLVAVALLSLVACSDSGGGGGDDAPPGCGDGTVANEEQCDDGNDNNFDGCRNDCTSVDMLMPTPMTWQYFETPGTACIDGTPAGFSVNYNPASTKLFIYFEGGGACFNQFCESLFTRSGMMPGNGGLFDRVNTANPVRDWSWIYVPYCSGDVYGGNTETMVAGKMRTFHGYTNHTAFLERWVPSFPSDTVVLSGASAGGFGAAVNYAQTQRAFGETPVILVDDSGPPMSSAVFPPCLQTLWRMTWGFDRTVLAECGSGCSNQDDFVEDLFAHTRSEFPNMRGGLFSSVGDQTIRAFAGYGWSGGHNRCDSIPSPVTQQVFQTGLEEIRTTVGTGTFGTFYVPGNGHTILRSGNVYTSMAGGKTVATWIGDLIGGTASHLGP